MLESLTLAEGVRGVLIQGVGAVLGTILGLWRGQVILKTKLDSMDEKYKAQRESERELSTELKDAVREIRTVSIDVKVIIAEQAVINRVNNLALAGITEKVEAHGKLLGEHGQALALIRELLIVPRKGTAG